MQYHHYIPEDPLSRHAIQSIWQVDHATAFHHETIVPKGIIEVIFNFSTGDPIVAQVGGQACTLPACFISGFSTSPVHVQLPKQQVFFGVLFQPFAVRQLFGVPAGEFADATIDLSLVSPACGLLWEALHTAKDFDKRVGVLLAWLTTRLFVPAPREQFIHHFLSSRAPYEHTVTTLAAELCYSPRQLSRKMAEVTGMNTELVLLYKRYLHALQLVHSTPLSLTAIAHRCGFADQSHFIKAFKGFTECTPGEYRRGKGPVMAHLYKDVR